MSCASDCMHSIRKVACLDVFVAERKRCDLVLALHTSAKPCIVEGLALKDGEQPELSKAAAKLKKRGRPL